MHGGPVNSLLSALFLVQLVPVRALANCESGAWQIHTIAAYKERSRQKVYMRYAVNDRLVQAGVNFVDYDPWFAPSLGATPLQLRFPGGACVIAEGWQVDPAYHLGEPYSATSELPYRIPLTSCPALASRVPASGYLIADFDAGIVQLPSRQLRVASGTIDDETRRDLDADIATRTLYIESYGWPPDRHAGRIPEDRIVGRRIAATQVGEGRKRFVMAIMLLRIERALELVDDYSRSSLRDADVGADDRVDFPVIFFKHPARPRAYFVGDGSWCSGANFTRYPDRSVGAAGEFSRFRISQALDFDGDGGVDVLQINDTFAYAIDGRGNLEVIDHATGC